MEYLESKLDAEVDLQKFQQLSGYSYALFSRLFSILADMTLAEYLRNRRLSEAVTDLRESSEKVIDIALKYGYESADAFSAAFKKFHGATPSEVRNGKPYRVFPRLQLSLKITGGKNMDIKIQKKPAFTVAGVLLEAIVPVKGAIPASIHHAWKYVLEVFFPETGYRHSGAPDFEVYTEGDMSSPDYQMELWIPVIKY